MLFRYGELISGRRFGTEATPDPGVCERCGYPGGETDHDLPDNKCWSCRRVDLPIRSTRTWVDGKLMVCVPWHGDFDADERPVKNGRLHRPGERICGNSDCVCSTHIMAAEKFEAPTLPLDYAMEMAS